MFLVMPLTDIIVRWLVTCGCCVFIVQSDILEHLPQLIKQQPAVMREVMNRLLGCQSKSRGCTAQKILEPITLAVAKSR